MTTRAKMKETSALVSTRTPSTANVIAQAEANPKTFLGTIIKQLGSATAKMLESIKQDAGKGANASRVLAELFMWNWIRKYAESKYDKLLESAKEQGVVESVEEEKPGSYIAAESRHFVIIANVTEPIRRFNPDALAQWLFDSHKIPIIVTKEQMEKAKLPTKPQVRLSIEERA